MDSVKLTNPGLDCNTYNDPKDTVGWPARCKVPFVQYGIMDEPYYATDLLPFNYSKPLNPCNINVSYSLGPSSSELASESGNPFEFLPAPTLAHAQPQNQSRLCSSSLP